MGYVIIGETIFGDPEEGSNKAVSNDLIIRCELCNTPAPEYVVTARWMCDRCHAVM